MKIARNFKKFSLSAEIFICHLLLIAKEDKGGDKNEKNIESITWVTNPISGNFTTFLLLFLQWWWTRASVFLRYFSTTPFIPSIWWYILGNILNCLENTTDGFVSQFSNNKCKSIVGDFYLQYGLHCKYWFWDSNVDLIISQGEW